MGKRRYYHNGKRCSKGEKRIMQFLEKHDIEYEKEKTYESCRSLKGNLLRFDFFIEENNMLIEFDGQHHIKPVNKYRRAQRVHAQTVKHDAIKDNFVYNRDIVLLRIPYKDMNNIEYILEEELL